jgi:hypothetical protein
VKYDHDGPKLDSFLDVTALTVSNKPHIVEAVRRKMGLEPNTALDSIQHNIQMIQLRPRLDGACDGPFLVHTATPLDRDQLEKMLQNKPLLAKIRKGGRL